MRKPEQELAEIKSMMERSTRFLSLSGLAGILAGVYALLAAGLTYFWIYYPGVPFGNQNSLIQEEQILNKLVSTALLVLCLAVGTAWFLSRRKSEKKAQQFWTPAGRRFVLALFIPVVTGAIFCLALTVQGQFVFVAPATLIFYGLGLLNASHFTLSGIRYLGFGQLLLGLFAGFFPNYGLLMWSFGFGFLHIIYGTLMYLKYDR
jgi:hypothetical protein